MGETFEDFGFTADEFEFKEVLEECDQDNLDLDYIESELDSSIIQTLSMIKSEFISDILRGFIAMGYALGDRESEIIDA